MSPPTGGNSGGLPSRVEYFSPQGVFLPLVYRTSASFLWLELRGPAAWQAAPSRPVCRPACRRLLPWLRVNFAMVADAAWLGSDQWPWGTVPATDLAAQLGRLSASDPWGVVCSALSLCCPRCVRACGGRGPLALGQQCARSVCPVCGVRGHSALVHRCAPCVRHTRGVGGFVGVHPEEEKWKRRARTLQAQAWAVGAAVQQCCVPHRGAHCWCISGGCAPRVRLACHDVHGCG